MIVGGEVPKSAHHAMRPYIKHALCSGKTLSEDSMGAALETLAEDGTSQQSEEAEVSLREWRNRNTTCICGEYDISARRGTVFETDKYRIAEVRIGDLFVECADFGGYLKLNTSLQKKLNVGKDIRAKK